MNVFTPYPSPLDCAKALYGDKRFQKQILEIDQIIRAIEGAIPWSKHPCVLMYKDHKEWLECYLKCFESYKLYMTAQNDTTAKVVYADSANFFNAEANKITPSFITNDMVIQHRKRLYTKSPDLYPQFAQYGTSEENWYYVNGQIIKYINGKRL